MTTNRGEEAWWYAPVTTGRTMYRGVDTSNWPKERKHTSQISAVGNWLDFLMQYWWGMSRIQVDETWDINYNRKDKT